MPFEIDIKDGSPESGEDKRFEFIPRDEDGNAITRELQKVELTMTDEDGNEVTRSRGDFAQDGDTRYVMVPLDSQGQWHIDLLCEGPQGYRERTGTGGNSDNVYVDD